MRLWLIMLTVTVVIVSGYAHGYDRVTIGSRLWSHLILSWWYDHNRDHDLVANRSYHPFHLSSSWSINATAIFSLSILIGCDRIDRLIKSGQPSAKVSNNLVEFDQSLGSTQYSNQAWSTDMVHAVSLAHIPIFFDTVDFSLFSWYGLFRIRERSWIHVVLQVIRSDNLESPLIHFTTDSNRYWTWPC